MYDLYSIQNEGLSVQTMEQINGWCDKIITDRSLTSKDKLTAFLIARFVDENLNFIANIKMFSVLSNLKERTIARSLGHLRYRGYILIDFKSIYVLGNV